MPTSDFTIEHRGPAHAAVVRASGARSELTGLFGECFGKVFGTLAEKSIAPASAPIVRYLNTDEPLQFEAGAMVAGSFPGGNDVAALELPAGDWASAVYAGPYDDMIPAHEALQAWIAEQGRTWVGTSIEEYITDPGESPDPATWLTKISYPLA